MSKIILFNKPFNVLSQFSDSENRETLKNYIQIPKFYPAGRLDRDSEGLLVLTDNGQLQQKISHPKYLKWKKYLIQVDGDISNEAIEILIKGVNLKDGVTLPAKAKIIDEPDYLWPRTPPIRYRANIPTSWLELSIREGKNRQVKRMTAAVGFPTLRLIRFSVDTWSIKGINPGEYKIIEY